MRITRRFLSIAPLVLAIGCKGKESKTGTITPVKRVADARAVTALSYWTGVKPGDLAKYPAPVPVATIVREADIPRIVVSRPSAGAQPLASASNTSVKLDVIAAGNQPAIFGNQAPAGSSFMVVDTRWTNVHSKQRMDKAAAAGAADRTMGAGSFARGRNGGSAADSVDVDVAYQIPRLADNVYLVADGSATAIHPVTEEIPGGPKIGIAFTIAKLGDSRDARLAFIVPGSAKDVALQFFDYKYGHILVPIRGDAKRAAGDGTPSGSVLDKAQTAKLDVAAHSLVYASEYRGVAAPQGWRYAIVQIGGRGRSVRSGIGDIVQIDASKFIWLVGEGGYVYPSIGGPAGANTLLRFTPEIYQKQEVAFLVPSTVDRFRLGLRAETEMVELSITEKKPGGIPGSKGGFKDGKTLEVLYLGSHAEGNLTIVDLAIRPLETKGQGIEITPDQQFMIETVNGPVRPDMAATSIRINRPARPFVVPPGTTTRFELAYPASGALKGLKIRGFESEGRIAF